MRVATKPTWCLILTIAGTQAALAEACQQPPGGAPPVLG
jgi:hypothetical protein